MFKREFYEIELKSVLRSVLLFDDKINSKRYNFSFKMFFQCYNLFIQGGNQSWQKETLYMMVIIVFVFGSVMFYDNGSSCLDISKQ